MTKAIKASAASVLGVLLLVALDSQAAFAGDSSGYYYGADLTGPGPSNGSIPYLEPICGGAYGTYIGRINSVPDGYNNTMYSDDAAKNAAAGYGVGPMSIIDLQGPGVDKATTTSAAEAWGEDQARTAIANFQTYYDENNKFVYPVIWADAESGNGGYSTSTKALDRDVLTGFNTEIRQLVKTVVVRGVSYTPLVGVYTAPIFWSDYMSGTLSTMYEWTYEGYQADGTSNACATGFTAPHSAAEFFAGYTTGSACALVWQFMAGSADYDSLYATHLKNKASCT